MREKQKVLKEIIDETKKKGNLGELERWESVFTTFVEAKLTLDNVPTVDAAPVRHGHWVEDGYYGLPNVCSWCGEENKEMAKYCPHCGALMDEEVQDGKN